jgi:hypothetical protein
MIRFILRFLDDWYSDSHRPTPRWIQRWIASNPRWEQERRRSHQLEDQLRLQARTEIESYRRIRELRDREPIAPPSRLSDATRETLSLPERAGFGRPIGSTRRLVACGLVALGLAASVLILLTPGPLLWQKQQPWASGTQNQSESISGGPSNGSRMVEGSAVPPGETPTNQPTPEEASGPMRILPTKKWLDRATAGSKIRTMIPLEKLDETWKREVLAIEKDMEAGARFFVVKLPVAGIKMFANASK